MEQWKSWVDWVNVVLGVVLIMWGVTPGGAIEWSILLGGVAIALVAIWSLAAPEQPTPERVNVLLGLWVAVAPLMLGYTQTPNAAVSRLVGPCVAAIAVWRARSIEAGGHASARLTAAPQKATTGGNR